MEKSSSIFSNYLAEAGLIKPDEGFLKATDIYTRLRNTYNQGVKGLCLCRRIFLPPEDEDRQYFEDLLVATSCNYSELENIIRWVNERIVFQLDISTYRTIGVRLRIATGMINKLVYDGKITKDLGMRLHYHLVRNISAETTLLCTEDLPF